MLLALICHTPFSYVITCDPVCPSRSVGRFLGCWSACYIFLKGREVTLPCSYCITYFLFYSLASLVCISNSLGHFFSFFIVIYRYEGISITDRFTHYLPSHVIVSPWHVRLFVVNNILNWSPKICLKTTLRKGYGCTLCMYLHSSRKRYVCTYDALGIPGFLTTKSWQMSSHPKNKVNSACRCEISVLRVV